MFKATVRLPPALAAFAAGLTEIRVSVDDGATVRDLFEALREEHPEVVDRVIDDAGRQHRHVNIFLGPDSIRALKELDTAVYPGAEITILWMAGR
jgi:molybdopterin synthase sulfur carrier subunit